MCCTLWNNDADAMVTVAEAVFRLKRVPPRRLPVVVGRYALRMARARTRRWHIERNRGELSDAALERSLGGVSVDEAFERFMARFFVDPRRARHTAVALRDACPALADRTREKAEAAVEHVADLLGSGPVRLGERIDWHRDFRTGIAWPRDVLAEEQDHLRLGEPCDVKMPWELSRCHHWVTLGRAHALEPRSAYASEFVAQFEAWLEDNPWPYGINWCRAMEAAVRAVNWLWAAALFADAPDFSASVKRRFLKALLQHGRHILDNLEYADRNGNHYLSNGVGLVYLGVLLGDMAEAPAWRRKGFEIIWGEIEQQVHDDGVDFEQGIGYHGLVTEFWYSSVLLCDRNGIPVPHRVRERLEKMFDFMLAYTRPDGTFPQVGDNDDGRLANLDDEPPGSHRRHLAVGGAMFGRTDLLSAAGDAVGTAAWLCGPDVLRMRVKSPPPPVVGSREFPEGGFFVMRAPDAIMLIDAGDVGMRGIGGHGHNDVLSFDLWAAGAPLLSDSGTYTYSADSSARNALRGTAAHNAVRVDGAETSRLGPEPWLWLIENDAHPFDIRWHSTADEDVFAGSHDGYRRLAQPVVHTRRITFGKQQRWWRIDDELDGRGEHLIELFLHPALDCEFDDSAVRMRATRADLWIFPPHGTTHRREAGWISRAYGVREPATVLVYAVRAPVPLTLRTDLVLVAHGTPAGTARSLIGRD